MRKSFKTVAVALTLALSAATLADASANTVAAPSATSSPVGKATATPTVKTGAMRGKTVVRGKTAMRGETAVGNKTIVRHNAIGKVSVLGRHHARLAALLARHRRLAHRPLRTKIVQRAGFKHLAQNHRIGTTSSVIR